MAFVSSFTAVSRPATLASAVCGVPVVGATVAAAPAKVTMAASKSVPFLPEPQATAGLVGSVGFDPLSLSTAFDIDWLREAELKVGLFYFQRPPA
jgi:hypothetical protein